MHARATQTHSCCFCFDRCLCARHTDTHYTAATHNRVILFPSSPCLPNQSIATVFTVHSIWLALSSFFFAYGMPISHIRGHSSRSRQRGTHSHSHTRLGYPTNPTTSFQGSTASQLFLATTTTTSFSLSRCVFPPVLLTLDHWTKIDSPLLVLFSCLTFPLFYTFCVCFSTAPHTQLASLSTPFPFVSLIRQSSSPGGYSLLQQILHLNSTTSNCCPTVHTPFGTCVLAAAPLLLPLSSVASQVAKVQSGWHHQQLLHVVQIDSRVGCSMKLGAPDDDRRTKRTGEIDLSQRFAHTAGRSGTWLGFRHVAFSRQ